MQVELVTQYFFKETLSTVESFVWLRACSKQSTLFILRDTELAVLPDGLLNTIKRHFPQVNFVLRGIQSKLLLIYFFHRTRWRFRKICSIILIWKVCLFWVQQVVTRLIHLLGERLLGQYRRSYARSETLLGILIVVPFIFASHSLRIGARFLWLHQQHRELRCSKQLQLFLLPEYNLHVILFLQLRKSPTGW